MESGAGRGKKDALSPSLSPSIQHSLVPVQGLGGRHGRQQVRDLGGAPVKG